MYGIRNFPSIKIINRTPTIAANNIAIEMRKFLSSGIKVTQINTPEPIPRINAAKIAILLSVLLFFKISPRYFDEMFFKPNLIKSSTDAFTSAPISAEFICAGANPSTASASIASLTLFLPI